MLSAFKNESGSTALTVVVAIAVAVCLLSVSVQWYWVNSSASDVQLAADLGAMAEQEAIGRSVLLMQIFDVTILSANLLGLILHALVVVGGIATVAQSPIGGGVGAGLLTRLIEIDKSYVQRRKQFVDMLYSAATKLNKVTPYLAIGYARRLVDENNDLRAKFNKTRYGVIPVPFPFEGSVQRSPNFSHDAEVLNEVTVANQKNYESAADIKELSEKVEEMRARCFELDYYKDETLMPANWDVGEVVVDYSKGFHSIATNVEDQNNGLIPIENTSSNAQMRLDNEFKANEQEVQAKVSSIFSDAFGSPSSLDARVVTNGELYDTFLDKTVCLVPHDGAERKAYHTNTECSGLYNAQSEPENVTLRTVYGLDEHPPCSICLPFSWQAISVWKEATNDFLSRWNSEVEAISAYKLARQQMIEKQSELQGDTSSAFDKLLSDAQSMLASDRLTYRPPGSRGVLCIGYSQKQDTQPGFTLSRLTHTDGEKTGLQYAISAARLKPLNQSGYVSKIIQGQKSDYTSTNMRFGSGVYSFLNGDGGFFNYLSSLWYGVTNFYLKGTSGLENMFGNLPWGIGTIATNFMVKLQKVAGVSKPDLRTYHPFLVNTSEVGDPHAPGLEGAFVSQIREAKRLYNSGSKLSESTISSLAQGALAALPDSSFGKIYSQMFYSVFTATCAAPFSMSLASYSSSTIQSAQQAITALGW